MFNILHKYICKKFVLYFVATLFALSALSLLVDVIEMLRRIYDKPEVSFFLVLLISLTKLPFIMAQILPFCIMIAAIITFWNMTRSSELVIYRAVGMSAKNFISPLLVSAIIIGIISTTLFNPLVALMYSKHNRLLEKNGFSSDSTPFLSEDGLWLRENTDGLTAVIYAQDINLVNNELELKQVSIMNIKDDYIFVSRIEGEKGVIRDREIYLPVATIFAPEKIPEQVLNHIIRTSITVTQLQENMASPEKISFWDMPGIIAFFERTGFSASSHRLYFYSLLAAPLTFAAFIFAVAPFMLVTNLRKGSIFVRILLAVISGFGLFFFSKITIALGVSSAIPLTMAVIIPIAIASFCGFAAILHYEDG